MSKVKNVENEKRLKNGLPIVGSFEDVAQQWYQSKMSSKSASYQLNIKSHFHLIHPDKLLGYATTSCGKEIRIMRLAGESVHDFQCRCKEVIPIPSGSNAVILRAVYE